MTTHPGEPPIDQTELTDAAEQNLFALFRSMAVALPGAELVEQRDLSYHNSFPASPFFKGAWATRLNAPDADATIDRITTWFRERGARTFYWWTGSRVQPPDMDDRLAARGFVRGMAGDPGMGARIEDLAVPQPPAGLRIVRVRSDRELDDWRDVFVRAHGTPSWAGQAWVDATRAAGGEAAPWRLYLAYLGEDPVAISMMSLGAGAAGLYAVGTVPEARGRGIGSAVTLHPLPEALADGYPLTVLQASEMGLPVYRRIGYQELPISFTRWQWPGSDPRVDGH